MLDSFCHLMTPYPGYIPSLKPEEWNMNPQRQLSPTHVLCRTVTNTALLLLVGSRYFLHAYSFFAWSLLRCCLLGSSVQAQSVARVGWSGLRSWTCVGRGRLYVNSYLNLLCVTDRKRCVANMWFLQLPSAGVTRL